MSFVLTLVASEKPLTAGHLALVQDNLATMAIGAAGIPDWLEPHKAADIPLVQKPNPQQIRTLRILLESDKIDLFVNPVQNRRKKLLLADMDSTIVVGETLDELAGEASGPSIQRRIADITDRAMRGEVDFAAALRERVSMLEGLPETALTRTRDNMRFSPGAKKLVATMRANGAVCVLVSGGFDFFTRYIAEQGGFNHHHGNKLEIRNGQLTGKVFDPILDKQSKMIFLRVHAQKQGLNPGDTMAIGDGSNDLPMLESAGLGIGYRPKPVLREALDNCILYGDLSAALYAQGYRQAEFA
jgi:phosphoserine phosphatase